jgi:hypothetical protein
MQSHNEILRAPSLRRADGRGVALRMTTSGSSGGSSFGCFHSQDQIHQGKKRSSLSLNKSGLGIAR